MLVRRTLARPPWQTVSSLAVARVGPALIAVDARPVAHLASLAFFERAVGQERSGPGSARRDQVWDLAGDQAMGRLQPIVRARVALERWQVFVIQVAEDRGRLDVAPRSRRTEGALKRLPVAIVLDPDLLNEPFVGLLETDHGPRLHLPARFQGGLQLAMERVGGPHARPRRVAMSRAVAGRKRAAHHLIDLHQFGPALDAFHGNAIEPIDGPGIAPHMVAVWHREPEAIANKRLAVAPAHGVRRAWASNRG